MPLSHHLNAEIARLSAFDSEQTPTVAAGTQTLRDLETVRSWLIWVETKAIRLVNEAASRGDSTSADDILISTGTVSARERNKRRQRTEIISEIQGLEQALTTGNISAEHVDAIGAVLNHLNDETRSRLLAEPEIIVTAAEENAPDQFTRRLAVLKKQAENEGDESIDQRQRRETYFRQRINLNSGMYEGEFSLHPELGHKIMAAIRAEIGSVVKQGTETNRRRERLAAEALGTLVTRKAENRPTEADITIVITEDEALSTFDGADLPTTSLRRLACNATLTALIVDSNRVPIDQFENRRLASRRQRRALRALYPTCAITNCAVPFTKCEIHHLKHRQHGGPTRVDNLIPICITHHHRAHEHGWKMELEPDRKLIITHQNGDEHHHQPPQLEPNRSTDHQAA